MKAWITKFALTQGVFTVEGERSGTTPSMLVVKQENTYSEYYHGEGRDWHLTEESAGVRATQMVKDKIKSLKKQITKIEKMRF